MVTGSRRRIATALVITSLTANAIASGTVRASTLGLSAPVKTNGSPPKILDEFTAPDGRKITVYAGNFARVADPKHHVQTVRYLPQVSSVMAATGSRMQERPIPNRRSVLAEIDASSASQPFIENEVVAVLRPGTSLSSDRVRLSKSDLQSLHAQKGATALFPYSSDAALNGVLSRYAVGSADRLFTRYTSRIEAMRTRSANASRLLPVENTYLFHFTRGRVRDAVVALRRLPSILYAGANFRVSPTNVPSIQIPQARQSLARERALEPRSQLSSLGPMKLENKSAIPTNYTVAGSAQSFLNAPGVNAIAAYDEIESQFKQLPGTGQTITDVSIGDVDSIGASSDPCTQYLKAAGAPPTTIVQGGQRYLNIPTLPLIPAYTADQAGGLDGMGEVCGLDPALGEIGLDFAVMAPLPDNLQRANEQGVGFYDLLGIAPGAEYRLVVPGSEAPASTDIAGAFLGAALQNPPPTVITASIGFGNDKYGFPSRNLEEDPVVRSVIASIVAQGITVCISAGDGLRTYTNAAVNPSGGTVPIDIASTLQQTTDLNDDTYSTIPSAVLDTGAISVGGTTLDDVTVAPPSWPSAAKYRDQQAFTEVRWDGGGNFASAFGRRVNISAPSDNIISLEVAGFTSTGGTSASAPMVAAAAAIALQVAKLTGKPLASPAAVRKLLASTATAVPNVLQSDQANAVGPQLNVGRAVETLLAQGGVHRAPRVERVAIAQRYPFASSDFLFTTDTDPAAIDLTGTYENIFGEGSTGCDPGCSLFQPITIAPDWETMPAGTHYKLYVTARPSAVLDTNPWSRLYPATILTAAGKPVYSSQTRTVTLTYAAYAGFHTLAAQTIALSFLPNQKTLTGMGPPPVVPPVVTGNTIDVQYDLSDVDPSYLVNPQIEVSVPGRTSFAQPGFHLLYKSTLTGTKGTLQIPVSALQGDGIYGIAIAPNGTLRVADSTTWAYTRVATAGSTRPPAPLLSTNGSASGTILPSGHIVDVPFGSPFNVSWDVTNVPDATGAILEISAAGPTLNGNYNPFNNPNGSIRDSNDIDSGSQVYLRLPSAKGTESIPSTDLLSAENQVVRVIPVAGSKAVGESSDVSTIVTHGIQTNDGGTILGGFEINPGGGDGIVSSTFSPGYVELNGEDTWTVSSSIQALDLATKTAGSTMAQNLSYNAEPIWGIPYYWPPWPSAPAYYSLSNLVFDQASDSAFAVEYHHTSFDWFQNVGASASQPSALPKATTVPAPPSATGELLGNGGGSFLYQTAAGASVFPATLQPSTSTLTWGNSLGFTPAYTWLVAGYGASAPGGYAFIGVSSPTQPYLFSLDSLDLTNGTGTQIALPNPNVSTTYTGFAILPASKSGSFVAIPTPYQEPSTIYFVNYKSNTVTTQDPKGLLAVASTPLLGKKDQYVAILSIFGSDVATNDNALSALDIVSPSGRDTSLETSNLINIADVYQLNEEVNAPQAPNWIGADQSTQTIYTLGPNGGEIQVIPTKGL